MKTADSRQPNATSQYPQVSILIAARNEAKNIGRCMEALDRLSYPKNQLQILIGDDDSDDETATLIKEFIQDKPHFQLVSIKPAVVYFSNQKHQQLKGKANVLAQLAHDATGDYFFFTDADIAVPTDWIQNMLAHFKSNVGIVTGITTMAVNSNSNQFLSAFQALEWLFYLSIMRICYFLHIPVSALGNNMAIPKEVYKRLGGFENIPFSITEDYEIFKHIIKQHDFVQLYQANVLAYSIPIPSWQKLMIQRKRWMNGAIALPILLRFGTLFNGLILPILIVLAIFNASKALFIAGIYYVLTTVWTLLYLCLLRLYHLLGYAPFFWFYHVFVNFAMLFNFYTTKNTTWKGRTY